MKTEREKNSVFTQKKSVEMIEKVVPIVLSRRQHGMTLVDALAGTGVSLVKFQGWINKSSILKKSYEDATETANKALVEAAKDNMIDAVKKEGDIPVFDEESKKVIRKTHSEFVLKNYDKNINRVKDDEEKDGAGVSENIKEVIDAGL